MLNCDRLMRQEQHVIFEAPSGPFQLRCENVYFAEKMYFPQG